MQPKAARKDVMIAMQVGLLRSAGDEVEIITKLARVWLVWLAGCDRLADDVKSKLKVVLSSPSLPSFHQRSSRCDMRPRISFPLLRSCLPSASFTHLNNPSCGLLLRQTSNRLLKLSPPQLTKLSQSTSARSALVGILLLLPFFTSSSILHHILTKNLCIQTDCSSSFNFHRRQYGLHRTQSWSAQHPWYVSSLNAFLI